MKDQYQHFVSKFLLRNFSEDSIYINKFENNAWECCKIDETGGKNLFYGPFNCSLELFFNKLERVAAQIVRQPQKLSPKEEK